jgi:hypothetical protein
VYPFGHPPTGRLMSACAKFGKHLEIVSSVPEGPQVTSLTRDAGELVADTTAGDEMYMLAHSSGCENVDIEKGFLIGRIEKIVGTLSDVAIVLVGVVVSMLILRSGWSCAGRRASSIRA